ncbi:MAG: hypothetical protein KGM43_17640 [Planctomycetota bacterium]|nr:hypothetical protein [Planctomycetota bacterium]
MTAPAASGVAIVAENGPILDWAEQRRQPFSHYEQEVAVVACAVGASHLREYEPAIAAELESAANNPGFSMRWGPLYFPLPGPDRDASDAFRLDRGLASSIDILQEREDLTREQAIARIEQIKEDEAKYGNADNPMI